jgi:hypothetical protein
VTLEIKLLIGAGALLGIALLRRVKAAGALPVVGDPRITDPNGVGMFLPTYGTVDAPTLAAAQRQAAHSTPGQGNPINPGSDPYWTNPVTIGGKTYSSQGVYDAIQVNAPADQSTNTGWGAG